MTSSTHEGASHAIAGNARSNVWGRIATERIAVSSAIAIIALHVVDDSFLQPEPGTSVADHAVTGLVLVALLAGAAVAYGRVRPGTRATLALLAGFFGVLSGIEAAYYSLNGGPSGDDFSGAMAMLSGFVLLGVGVVTLWRSRRTDGSRLRRYVRRTAITIGALILILNVLFPTAIAYVVTHTARAGVPAPNLGAAHEEVSFATSDGLRLHGWFVPSRNGATVIALPGRSGPQKHTRMLVNHGYGVLLFDRRGEGASDGDPNLFGWHGERDIHAAAAFLLSRADVDPERIGGIGLSIGGEMLIHAASGSNVFKAIVSEGASGQSIRDGWANNGLTSEILADSAISLATALFTNDLPPPSLKSEAKQLAPTAAFFVYGENGQGGSETRPNQSFHAVAGAPKQIWEVPEGQHIAGITTQPDGVRASSGGVLRQAPPSGAMSEQPPWFSAVDGSWT